MPKPPQIPCISYCGFAAGSLFTRVAAIRLLLAGATPCFAITDEIQVYTDEINKPGEYGMELHVNTTPSGRSTPDYPGDSPPRHGLRLTPEFSYGISKDFEAGLYVLSGRDAEGNLFLGGAKVRLKWLPVKAADEQPGWYAGVNFELSNVTKKFSESPWATEMRMIGGYRAEKWLIGVNPILDWDLSPGHRNGGPDLIMAYKAIHDIVPGFALGMEYYNAAGKLNHQLPHSFQDKTAYLVLEVDRKPWIFNIGIGRGLTPATDNWTLKAIFELPFN